MDPAPDLFSYRRHWAHKLGVAPELPMSRAEMDLLGWDACDVIIVTGDAYVDHPSFGMAIVGRLLEAQGFRVGIISQPDWTSKADFERLGRPTLFFGITAGNMDSMVNRYTSDRRLRSDDAYTPDGAPGRRPDRCVTVYAQRTREAFKDVPIVIGGIEASLRRIAHYDYWSEKVRRSALVDAKADLLLFGNAEPALVEVAHRLAKGEPIQAIRDVRGTGFLVREVPEGWTEIDSSHLDDPGPLGSRPDPYAMEPTGYASQKEAGGTPAVPIRFHRRPRHLDRARTVVRLPSFEQVRADPVLYAHASRVFHQETNPGNARALIQGHGDRAVWLNPPPIPLTTRELDRVYELPYARRPHSSYGESRIPAWEMIRFSVSILRGCFGGCTFCSITEHEGRIIQSRSEASILREMEEIRDHTPGFTGTISDLGGPTANMWRLACADPRIESACRRPSCVYPEICPNLNTDHGPLIQLYRKARKVPGIKRVLIASGLRYDLAVRSPEYVRELVTHHVGGLFEDRAGAHGARATLQDDEARDRHLRPLQGAVRQVLAGGGQGAVPDPLLHLRPSGDHRRGHAEPGPVAQAKRLSTRPGPGLPAHALGHRLRHVPHGSQSPEAGGPPARGAGKRGPGCAPTAPAQGLPALSRPGELAAPARGPQGHGALGPDRQRQAPPGARLPARRNWQDARGSAPAERRTAPGGTTPMLPSRAAGRRR